MQLTCWKLVMPNVLFLSWLSNYPVKKGTTLSPQAFSLEVYFCLSYYYLAKRSHWDTRSLLPALRSELGFYLRVIVYKHFDWPFFKVLLTTISPFLNSWAHMYHDKHLVSLFRVHTQKPMFIAMSHVLLRVSNWAGMSSKHETWKPNNWKWNANASLEKWALIEKTVAL